MNDHCIFTKTEATATCSRCGFSMQFNVWPIHRQCDAITSPLSVVAKVKNFVLATAKHVAAGMPTCSDEEILRRHDICMGCEFYKDSACTQCGCPVRRDRQFISKLAWADQSCPVGKWGPVEG